jgi:hypothetical protein
MIDDISKIEPREGFVRRLVNDTGTKIAEALDAGYTPVWVKFKVGDEIEAWLMEMPIDEHAKREIDKHLIDSLRQYRYSPALISKELRDHDDEVRAQLRESIYRQSVWRLFLERFKRTFLGEVLLRR